MNRSIELVHLALADSTNAELRRLNPAANVAVWAEHQTAGRGQRGNVWLSRPGCNLLLSAAWHPTGLKPARQFALSMAAALAVADTLAFHGIAAKVKWPNDIYVDNRKICGILIENAVGVTLERSIIGIGLNVNQLEFPPSLPNPVSMRQLTGRRHNRHEVATTLLGALERLLPMAETEEGAASLHSLFMQRMWRGDGLPHPFRDTATGERFMAAIEGVLPSGLLCLTGRAPYAFKEVEFLL